MSRLNLIPHVHHCQWVGVCLRDADAIFIHHNFPHQIKAVQTNPTTFFCSYSVLPSTAHWQAESPLSPVSFQWNQWDCQSGDLFLSGRCRKCGVLHSKAEPTGSVSVCLNDVCARRAPRGVVSLHSAHCKLHDRFTEVHAHFSLPLKHLIAAQKHSAEACCI